MKFVVILITMDSQCLMLNFLINKTKGVFVYWDILDIESQKLEFAEGIQNDLLALKDNDKTDDKIVKFEFWGNLLILDSSLSNLNQDLIEKMMINYKFHRFNTKYLNSINFEYRDDLFENIDIPWEINDYILKVENLTISPSNLLIILNLATIVGKIIFKNWVFILDANHKFLQRLNFKGRINLSKITLENINFMQIKNDEIIQETNKESLWFLSINVKDAWENLYTLLEETGILSSIIELNINGESIYLNPNFHLKPNLINFLKRMLLEKSSNKSNSSNRKLINNQNFILRKHIIKRNKEMLYKNKSLKFSQENKITRNEYTVKEIDKIEEITDNHYFIIHNIKSFGYDGNDHLFIAKKTITSNKKKTKVDNDKELNSLNCKETQINLGKINRLLRKFSYTISIHHYWNIFINFSFWWWNNTSSQSQLANYHDYNEENLHPNTYQKVDVKKFLFLDKVIFSNCLQPDKVRSDELLVSASYDSSIITINWAWFNKDFRYNELLYLLWTGLTIKFLNFGYSSTELLNVLIDIFESAKLNEDELLNSKIEFVSSKFDKTEDDMNKKLKSRFIKLIKNYTIENTEDFKKLCSKYIDLPKCIRSKRNSYAREELKSGYHSNFNITIKDQKHHGNN